MQITLQDTPGTWGGSLNAPPPPPQDAGARGALGAPRWGGGVSTATCMHQCRAWRCMETAMATVLHTHRLSCYNVMCALSRKQPVLTTGGEKQNRREESKRKGKRNERVKRRRSAHQAGQGAPTSITQALPIFKSSRHVTLTCLTDLSYSIRCGGLKNLGELI